MKKKNVLILQPDAFFGNFNGGSFVQAAFYKDFLKEKGCQTFLFRGLKGESFFRRWSRLSKEVGKSEVLISFGAPFSGWIFAWVCWFFKRRGIFCLDTGFETKSVFKENFKKDPIPTVRFIFWDLVKLLVVSFFLIPEKGLVFLSSCEYVKKRSGRKFAKMIRGVVYPRVSDFSAVSRAGKDGLKKTILYYGHLNRGRGIGDLLRACQNLWDSGRQFTLLILGYPVDKTSKKELFKLIRKTDNVKVFGQVRDLKKYFRKAEIIVLPFRYSCSYQPPLTLLEAMKAGIPVITTNIGANKEWIENKKTGLVCNPKDPKDLASKIEMILKKSSLGAMLAEEAKEALGQKYQEENQIIKLIVDGFYEK